MRQFAAAIAAFLSRTVTRIVHSMQLIGGRMVSVARTVVEAVPTAAGGLLQMADAVVSAPFRLASHAVRSLSGRGAPAPTEQAAVAQATQSEAGMQAHASQKTGERQMLRAVRALALARVDGTQPDADMVASIPAQVAAYVAALDLSECRTLSTRSASDVRALLEGRPLPGVRTPDQVASAQERHPAQLEVLTDENAYEAMAPRMRAA